MSLYIGKDASGNPKFHLAGSDQTVTDLKNNDSVTSTVLSTSLKYLTGQAFNAESIAVTTSGSSYWVVARFSSAFTDYVNRNTEKRIYLIDNGGYDSSKFVTGFTGSNALYRFYDINMANETRHPVPGTRYVKYASVVNPTTVRMIVLDIDNTGTYYTAMPQTPASITINSNGLFFDSVNFLSIGLIVTPPVNTVDYKYTIGSTEYQILNSNDVNNGFSFEKQSNGNIVFKDGTKEILNSSMALQKFPSNFRHEHRNDGQVYLTASNTRHTLFTITDSRPYAIVSFRFVASGNNMAFLLPKDGAVQWFLYENSPPITSYVGIRYLNGLVYLGVYSNASFVSLLAADYILIDP